MSDAAPEPSYAERARTLVHVGRVGALSTISRRVAGAPFGSVAPYGVDAEGNPTFLLSTLAMHTQNLLADDRASLLVNESSAPDTALAAARVTVVGRARQLAGAAAEAVRDDYLARQPSAQGWIGFKDFAFFQLDVSDAYYVAGFGVMGWVSATGYHGAAADPLADYAAGILEHMNTDHADAVLLYARKLAGIPAESAAMISIDRLGFSVQARADDQSRTVRLSFPSEVRTSDEARQALIGLLRTARAS